MTLGYNGVTLAALLRTNLRRMRDWLGKHNNPGKKRWQFGLERQSELVKTGSNSDYIKKANRICKTMDMGVKEKSKMM